MADPLDIAQVRLNTNEPNNVVPYDDVYIGTLVDAVGVVGATASIWESKAATIAATAVDITEADATHKLSDKFDHAAKMVAYWNKQKTDAIVDTTENVVRVRIIERSEL